MVFFCPAAVIWNRCSAAWIGCCVSAAPIEKTGFINVAKPPFNASGLLRVQSGCVVPSPIGTVCSR